MTRVYESIAIEMKRAVESFDEPCNDAHCKHAFWSGCMIPENALDGRGEPLVGQPLECRYFVHMETACRTTTLTTR